METRQMRSREFDRAKGEAPDAVLGVLVVLGLLAAMALAGGDDYHDRVMDLSGGAAVTAEVAR